MNPGGAARWRSARRHVAFLAALFAVASIGCTPAQTVSPTAKASITASTPSPTGTPGPTMPPDRFPDGLPRMWNGEPVVRAGDAANHAKGVATAAPFLVGGWLTAVPGPGGTCLPQASPSDAWLRPCHEPQITDQAGDPPLPLGAISFQFVDTGDVESGPTILRVHVGDARAATCGAQAPACAAEMVVDDLLWSGDAWTDPRPLTATSVADVLRSLQPTAELAPLGHGVFAADCGGQPWTARDYAIAVAEGQLPVVSFVAISPTAEALARALPQAEGAEAAIQAPPISTSTCTGPNGSGSFACRWLRVQNAAVIVRTSSPPTPSDRTFMEALATQLATRRP